MDEDTFEKAKDEDMSLDEAEELQDIVDDTGVDVSDAYDLWLASQ